MSDDEPPWDMQPPEPEFMPETRRSAPGPSPRPTTQARGESEPPRAEYSPPSAAAADDRYITAIKNIFNAVEVKHRARLLVEQRGATNVIRLRWTDQINARCQSTNGHSVRSPSYTYDNPSALWPERES